MDQSSADFDRRRGTESVAFGPKGHIIFNLSSTAVTASRVMRPRHLLRNATTDEMRTLP